MRTPSGVHCKPAGKQLSAGFFLSTELSHWRHGGMFPAAQAFCRKRSRSCLKRHRPVARRVISLARAASVRPNRRWATRGGDLIGWLDPARALTFHDRNLGVRVPGGETVDDGITEVASATRVPDSCLFNE
jgi:hypothetical protein